MYIKSFTNVDPNVIKNPIKVEEFVVVKGVVSKASPEVVTNLLMSQTIFYPHYPYVCHYFLLSDDCKPYCKLKKKIKTLETLMTVPIKPLIILQKCLLHLLWR